MKLRNMLKKTLAVVLAFAMVAPVMANLEANVKEVKANSATAVSDDSLNVKFQVTQGVVTKTDIDAYKGKYVMRVVTSVENPEAYDALGFKVMKFGDNERDAKTAKVKTVFKRIESTTGSTDTEKETYTYSPKVIAINGEYFATAKIVITPDKVNQDYVVWAYGTQNGQRMEGSKRVVRVTDGLVETKTLNISFDTTSDVVVGDVLDVAYGSDANANTHNTTAKIIAAYPTANGTIVSVRTQDEIKDNLKSANKFVFTKSEAEVGNTVVRNHTIQYNGSNADTSWYDVYETAGADNFVIASSADLYGLASLTKLNYQFSVDKIYIVSDIKINSGDATAWSKSNAPAYTWTPMSSTTYPFKGYIDAQMHTISGVYLKHTKTYGGLFAATDGATIKNLKLTDSYFYVDNQYGGSLVAYAYDTTLDTIYSDATVENESQRLGGFIGQLKGGIVKDCWFDGSIIAFRSKAENIAGGLVGEVVVGTEVNTTTMENCLNTANIDVTYASSLSGKSVRTGGLVGHIGSGATLDLNNALNAGTIFDRAQSIDYGDIVGWNEGTITGTSVYAISETLGTGVPTDGSITSLSKSSYKGESARTNTDLFNEDTWSSVPGNMPVPKCFETLVYDTSWYDESKDTYVLYDQADLLGFAALSQDSAYNGFSGKTIKLGADITFNKGNASTWGTTAPKREWVMIGNSTAFAGTFDGYDELANKVHQISGIYLDGAQSYVGLFSQVSASAKLQNFKLANSYFKNTGSNYVGSIVGLGKGTFHNVHSDSGVYVYSNKKNVGGLIGGTVNSASGDGFTMTQCSFAGYVTTSVQGDCEMGGLVGYIAAPNTIIENCLNTGTVAATNTSKAADIGGLVGCVGGNGKTGTRITNSLNLGSVTSDATTTSYKDSILAYNAGITNLVNLYTTSTTTVSGATPVTVDAIKGAAAKDTLQGFDFMAVWLTREGDTPVLNTDPISMNEYVVHNVEEFLHVADMSQTTNFAGKTIKLAADIDLDGCTWTPMCADDTAKRFAGTFDGQGYTISNLSVSDSAGCAGLFASTNAKAVIKNLIIDTATINSTNKFVGVIAGQGQGTYSDIKVIDSTVTGIGRMAGLIGLAEGSVTMSNCSFNGTVTCSGSDEDNRYVGGLIGYISAGNLKMSNCLNAGNVYGSVDCTADSPGVGGIVGCISASVKSVEINSCVNTGEVDAKSASALAGCGPIVGRLNVPTNGFDLYDLEKNYTVPCKDVSGVAEVEVVATATNETMPLLDWETQWEMVAGVPQVRFSKTGFVAGESLEVDASILTNLTTLYSANRELKQGDIHAHAKTDVDTDIEAIDGTVDLTTWKTQLLNLNMDFAASLDHQSTLHINNKDWDKDLFIYGSEIGVAVKDANQGNAVVSGVHQNVYFTNEDDFKKVLKSDTFQDAFDYLDHYSTAQYYNGGNFKLGALYTHTWKEFIETVQANNGFYVLAHPNIDPSRVTVDNWETDLKPYLVDGMGLEVMYKGLGTGNVKQCYQLWKTALNSGHKVYATAGTDTHDNLQTHLSESGLLEAFTSFYAAKADGETTMSEAYVRYLREGNFTAGSVGLQMSVGNTQMGGTGNFADAYLEVGIGALHGSAYVDGHKYRVEIWSDQGIVHSQQFNATTDESQMTYLRMKADEASKYYRVEVYDATTNTLIALGNPIWNES